MYRTFRFYSLACHLPVFQEVVSGAQKVVIETQEVVIAEEEVVTKAQEVVIKTQKVVKVLQLPSFVLKHLDGIFSRCHTIRTCSASST